MIVYNEKKKTFVEDAFSGEIENKIEQKMEEKMHRHTGKSEFHAWKNSMVYMLNIMNTPDIPDDCDIAIEYRIPNTNKRVDFIVAGEDEKGRESAVIIELKQWETLEKVDNKSGIVKTYLGGSLHETTHPSYQAYSYVSMIQDYNETARKNQMVLKPCAYLHNYKKKPKYDDLMDVIYRYYTDRAPCFTRTDAGALQSFISRYVKNANGNTLYDIDHGRIRPSKALQDCMASLLRGNEEFHLLDDQKVVFETIMALAKCKDGKKRVVIVQGGPGTGKSVVAINLLVQILNLSENVMYVTKNSAPRYVYSTMLNNGGYRKSQVDNLFKSSGSFTKTPANTFDALVVDEAHRLNEKSGFYGNEGENQIKELIRSAYLTVFMIDDHQRVTLKDIGSSEEIAEWAEYYHADVYRYELKSQFRCNGSDGYLSFIDDVLEIDDTANDLFDLDYDIRVYDDPNDVYKEVVAHNGNNKARMLAGYCWNWQKDGKNDNDVHDITIPEYNFGMSWNFKQTNTWAIDQDSVNQCGCIHTCQGLEFDYVGVIIGDDLRYEDGRVITDFTKRAKTDQSLKGIKKMAKEDPQKAHKIADTIIRNTYRTLLTRGQKGCFIYCTDQSLSEYLKRRIKQTAE